MKIKINESITGFSSYTPTSKLEAKKLVDPKSYQMDVLSEAYRLRNSQSNSWGSDRYTVMEAFTNIFSRVTASKARIIREVDNVSEFYLVDVVVNQMTEDALNPDTTTGEVFDLKYKNNERLTKILQKLDKDLDLDELVTDIVPDMLKYGEYILEVDTEDNSDQYDELIDLNTDKKVKKKKTPKGIIGVRDVLDQADIVSVYQGTNESCYLARTPDGLKLVKYPKEKFLKFSFGPSKIRVKIEDQLLHFGAKSDKFKEFVKTLPRYVRIGKSVVFPVRGKFRELELLEKMIPATSLNQLSNVNLLGVNVPQNFDIEKGMEVAQRLESFVNNKVGIDPKLQEITVESLVGAAGRSKVIPLFGDKGGVEKLDYKQEEPNEVLSAITDYRQVLTDSIGVPYEILYKSDGDTKGNVIKRHSRYIRRLRNIQKAVAIAIKTLCCTHLDLLGEKYDKDDIEIHFHNTLPEIEVLDELEIADTSINLLGNIKNFFTEMAEEGSPYAKNINLDAVGDYLNKYLRHIGLSDAINTKAEGGPEIKAEAPDDSEGDDAESTDLDNNDELPDNNSEDEIDNEEV